MKRPIKTALWCDCETDEERAEFFRNGRAYDTCVIAKNLAEPCAQAFEDAAKWRKLVGVSWSSRFPAVRILHAHKNPRHRPEMRDVAPGWLLALRSDRLERKEQTVKLKNLTRILNAIEAASDDAEVCIYRDGMAPLDIDHLQVMLDYEGNVSEVWLEVTE